MQILVTGAKGQLGHAIQELTGESGNHEFIFTDIEELDITNPDKLDKFFNEVIPGICINCAGYTAVDKAEEEKELAFKLNSEAVKLLGEVTARKNTKLIHISTDYVFNGHTWNPYSEMDERTADSIYGQSKAAGEKALSDLDHCIIVRTSWLYSEYGNNFFKTMVKLMQTREQINVVSDQVGTPSYAGDLARALMKIVAETEKDNFTPGIFHYSNEGVASWYDFAYEISRLVNPDCQINPIETFEYPLPAPRPAYSVLNKKRIKEVYGIRIPHWRESVQICYEKFKFQSYE